MISVKSSCWERIYTNSDYKRQIKRSSSSYWNSSRTSVTILTERTRIDFECRWNNHCRGVNAIRNLRSRIPNLWEEPQSSELWYCFSYSCGVEPIDAVVMISVKPSCRRRIHNHSDYKRQIKRSPSSYWTAPSSCYHSRRNGTNPAGLTWMQMEQSP
jgi:hypothetical protein